MKSKKPIPEIIYLLTSAIEKAGEKRVKEVLNEIVLKTDEAFNVLCKIKELIYEHKNVKYNSISKTNRYVKSDCNILLAYFLKKEAKLCIRAIYEFMECSRSAVLGYLRESENLDEKIKHHRDLILSMKELEGKVKELTK